MSIFKRFLPFIWTSVLGLCCVVGITILMYQHFITENRDLFVATSLSTASQLENKIKLQQEVVNSIQSAFLVQPTLNRQQFENIVGQSFATKSYSSILAMGFIRPVEELILDEFVENVRNDASFAAVYYAEFQPHPVSNQPQRHLIEFISPINRVTIPYLGYDFSALPQTLQNIQWARDYGNMLSGNSFVLAETQDQVFLQYLPIYKQFVPRATLQERRKQYLGTVVALVRINDLVSDLQFKFEPHGIAWQLIDQGGIVNGSGKINTVLAKSNNYAALVTQDVDKQRQLISLAGRQWQLELIQAKANLSPAQQKNLALGTLGGVLVIALFAAWVQYALRLKNAQEVDTYNETNYRARALQYRQMRDMVESFQEPLVLRQADGRISYANPAAEQRFAINDQPLVGQREPLLNDAEVGQLNTSLRIKLNHCDADGESRHYDVALHPLRDDGLNFSGSVLFARDISESQQQLMQLRQSRDRLVEMLELSSDWFWEQDAASRFTYVSGGFFDDLDVNPNLFMGKCRWELGAESLSETEWRLHREMVEAHQPYRDFEYRMYLNHQQLIFSVSGRPIFDSHGEFVGYRGVGRNVTAMRNAQSALLAEQQRAQATLESIADGVLTTDLQGRIDYINPVASSLLGWELDMARGQPLGNVFQSIDAQTRLPLADLVMPALQGAADHQGARRSVLLNKFGFHFQIEESAARIRDEDNRTLGVVLVFRDVSNWREEADPNI